MHKRPLSPQGASLVDSARRWMDDAMSAWAEQDHAKTIALAPLALEHLSKAVLWEENPVLLVPLDNKSEPSLLLLAADDARLDSPKLRTVGLAEALSRASQVVQAEPPVPPVRRNRIVACRNGAMHVGSVGAETGRHVLADCIALIAWLLNALNLSEREFFESNHDDARAILTARQSEIHQAVAAKLSKHRRQFETLMDAIDESVWAATLAGLESSAMTDYWLDEHDPDVIPARHQCPACQKAGAIYGYVEVDGDADIESKHGETITYGYWVVRLSPEFFVCNVCRLRLRGTQELEAAGLPINAYEPDSADLGDFDPGDYYAYDGDPTNY